LYCSRPLFFGVVIDLNLLKILLKMIFSSRPLFFGVVIDQQKNTLLGIVERVLVPFSSGWLSI
ncbi:hypothetical protein, partial [Staphylococcus epidermidis]|uniref:hypothetical protein n=1 Tax=Staphylococcus epidermidis TaxID=1282 RepID=UPI00399D61A9